MSKNWQIPRRTFLKGLGTAIALPMLDTMAPIRALAGSGVGNGQAPVRMACMFVPNGVNLADWTPDVEGADFDLPYIMQPLAPVKNDILVLSGLTNDKGRANGDGAGDHARSASVYLTGAQPLKSEGSSIHLGVSMDQIAAKAIGNQTRFASLELGTEKGRQSGNCDSGYSCAYSNNISWRDASTPMTKEVNPREVFERLFGNRSKKERSENRAKRQRYRKSILDFVLDDAKQLNKQVSGDDKHKLDEYFTAVREIEERIEKAERSNGRKPSVLAGYEPPSGIPDTYEEHIRLMGDMMILAFQADVTRVATFMIANAGSNKSYRFIGVNEGHHSLSHHQGNATKLSKISEINRFHADQLAYIVQKMKSIPEGTGTLLDNCMVMYGSGISDGNRHNNENLPVVMAGRGGGSILPGRHLRYSQETPLCNLYVSMLNRVGVSTQFFGDSTGSLRWLNG